MFPVLFATLLISSLILVAYQLEASETDFLPQCVSVEQCVERRRASCKLILKNHTANYHLADWVESTYHYCPIKDGSRAARSEEREGVSIYCCQKNSEFAQIISANAARPNQFPNIIYLSVMFPGSLDSGGNCGGSIYNNRWIITAAHCVINSDHRVARPEHVKIYVGLNHMLKGNNVARNQVYTGTRVVVHQGYRYLVPIKNDIALIQVDREIQYSKYAKPLRVAPKGFKPKGMAWLAGFGTSDAGVSTGALLAGRATIYTVDDENCRQVVQRWGLLNQNFCIGGGTEVTASSGDSGSPAFCEDKKGKPVHCGITSFIYDIECKIRGRRCADAGVINHPPAAYLEVSKYSKWLRDIAGIQEESELMVKIN